MDKRYSVLVVYQCDSKDGSGVGRSTLRTNKRRMSETHLKEIEEFIEEENDLKNVVITNFQYM
ncbi:hypothetical protein AB1K91_05225 [Terribacillus sp. 179-K 1B1 HS]|uniref:hypothetical protein n=1 Tax=Terribacillus sp. 179-K 1B1 HS TaxID=3142388 RepID=UPI0039A158B8